MWRYLTPLAVFGVLIVAFYFGLQRNPSEISSPLIGKPAPLFSLPDVRDPARQVSNADFRGKPYVLNVWGTWCAGCRQEHEALMQIARSNAVPILGLNWKDDREAAVSWLDQLGDPYVATAYDPEGRVAIDWGVYGAPETYLVGADGRILHKHIAAITLEVWQTEFAPHLAAAPASPATGAGAP